MNSESFQMFVEKLENDAVLREELRAAGFDSGMSSDAVAAFAKQKGYTFGADDPGQLTDHELDAVAGGLEGGLGRLGSIQEMRLQLNLERKSKAYAALSNLQKVMSNTLGIIISNQK